MKNIGQIFLLVLSFIALFSVAGCTTNSDVVVESISGLTPNTETSSYSDPILGTWTRISTDQILETMDVFTFYDDGKLCASTKYLDSNQTVETVEYEWTKSGNEYRVGEYQIRIVNNGPYLVMYLPGDDCCYVFDRDRGVVNGEDDVENYAIAVDSDPIIGTWKYDTNSQIPPIDLTVYEDGSAIISSNYHYGHGSVNESVWVNAGNNMYIFNNEGGFQIIGDGDTLLVPCEKGVYWEFKRLS